MKKPANKLKEKADNKPPVQEHTTEENKTTEPTKTETVTMPPPLPEEKLNFDGTDKKD